VRRGAYRCDAITTDTTPTMPPDAADDGLTRNVTRRGSRLDN
jgi:hypothetical protein